MNTCFLFIHHSDEEKYLSLTVTSQGHISAPLTFRTSEEVKQLQSGGAVTMVVLPSKLCSMHEVPLPWLGERKARAAIPYALEEQLAQSVTSLHFAFDRQHYKHNTYLVAVMDKEYLASIIDRLDFSGIEFDQITLDWFALQEGEHCVTEDTLLIYDKAFKGALSIELSDIYLADNPEIELLVFNDSASLSTENPTKSVSKTAKQWIATRLLNAKTIDLCQGEFQRGGKHDTTRFWYVATAGLLGMFVLSFFIINLTKVLVLNNKIELLDQEIEIIYKEFFPEAKQVISPRFRIEQSLKISRAGQESETFWMLLKTLGETYDPQTITIQQLLFQNQTLIVALSSKDFQALESLQQALQQSNIKVNQTQASSKEGQVMATLELKR
ncbi:type II secretion system protein GspL [Legionella impletisoli]|uniref:Type II secretion system protein L n=1 Tax=Legionella impletisoli TaxID=343510 RepID=A0A917NBD7_9GAMM|nr:type II secretion system protein GspL [Legionella impletisoli]GGI85336.1 type II secretion system protein L [Legionella impletisoli]